MHTESYAESPLPATGVLTVEEYAGTDAGVDHGRLNTFKLANTLRRKDAFTPVPIEYLREVEAVADKGTGVTA